MASLFRDLYPLRLKLLLGKAILLIILGPIKKLLGNLSISTFLKSQIDEISEPINIKTIIFKGENKNDQFPIIQINENITLSFDDLNANEEDYYYKIKHFMYEKNEYSKGRMCNTFHTKQEKYDKFFKEIINQVQYEKLLKDIEKAKYLCIVCEIYFRYYDLIKKDNKKWFFNLNYSIINQFYK